jgi:hypothetical protein
MCSARQAAKVVGLEIELGKATKTIQEMAAFIGEQDSLINDLPAQLEESNARGEGSSLLPS